MTPAALGSTLTTGLVDLEGAELSVPNMRDEGSMPVKYSVIPSTHLGWHRPPAELVKDSKAGDTNLRVARVHR